MSFWIWSGCLNVKKIRFVTDFLICCVDFWIVNVGLWFYGVDCGSWILICCLSVFVQDFWLWLLYVEAC
jgi:hypothetical protein